VWLLSLCGAAIAMASFELAESLGIWTALGAPLWSTRLLALLAGALLAPTRAGSLLWLAVGSLTTLATVVSYTPIVGPMIAPFVRDDVGSRTLSAADYALDAVVVLSGDLTDEGRITGPALDRLLSGIAEARARGLRTLALSTISDVRGARNVNSEADQRALMSTLASDMSVLFVHNARSTRDEAMAFSALARTRRWSRVLLVTSPSHTRRACRTFERAGLRVVCRAAAARSQSPNSVHSADARRAVFRDVVYEATATALYRLRGWN